MRLTKKALFIQPHNNVGLADKKRDKPFAFRKNHIYL